MGETKHSLEPWALEKALSACSALHRYEDGGGPDYPDWDRYYEAAAAALLALGRL